MSTSIMKPGTGCNPFYAKKHGVPIQNTLDNVLASFCESYQPTGATNSIDAAEMLFKGTKPDFSRPAPAPAAQEPPQVKEFAPQPADYGSTFGTSPRTAAAAPTPAPVSLPEPGNVDMEWALAPGHGWSERDSKNHTRALEFLDSKDSASAIRAGFDKSTELGESSFRKSGWGAALMTGSFLAIGAAFVVASPVGAMALACGGMGSVFKGISLMGEAKQDHNNGSILRDMATRLHQATYDTVSDKPSTRGNYEKDFSLWRSPY